jgi:DNA-binding transcriptional MerR regulator
MLTVSQLAQQCGLSRTALLYYESIGLMPVAQRSVGNYRSYGEKDVQRLKQICSFRAAGLKLEDIRAVIDNPKSRTPEVLRRRLLEIDAEIVTLRNHQQVILSLLQHHSFRRIEMITRKKWVAIMKDCGLSDEQMQRWHREFERSAPTEHQEFLEFLRIPADEITNIRQWSRQT